MNERKAAKYHDRLLAMLRRLEWHPHAEHGLLYCPRCGNFQDYGHGSGCELATLLAEIERDQ